MDQLPLPSPADSKPQVSDAHGTTFQQSKMESDPQHPAENPPAASSRMEPSKLAPAASSRMDSSKLTPAKPHPFRKNSAFKSIEWNTEIANISSYYRDLHNIGKGSYGKVYKAVDVITGNPVVLKFIKKQHEAEAVMESTALKRVSHGNVIRLFNYFRTQNHYVLVLEKMDTDLSRILHSQRCELTPEHVKFFMYELIRGVAHIHTHNIIHRDLKPGNLLINADCTLRIADFGMAVEATTEPINHDVSREIVTRWYRAPEILLALPTYTKAIDMWSIGCIFAEILSNRLDAKNRLTVTPLFPGKDAVDQLVEIFKHLGSPQIRDWPELSTARGYSWVVQQPIYTCQGWHSFFPRPVELQAIALLNRLLVYNPQKRITAEQALRHPYFEGFA